MSKNNLTTVILFFTPSLPELAFHNNPESLQSPPPDGCLYACRIPTAYQGAWLMVSFNREGDGRTLHACA
jgi:hypothetical protein